MSTKEKHLHSVPIWAIFAILLAFTVAEVGMFVQWTASYENAIVARSLGDLAALPFMSKATMVMVLLVGLTIPKAAIVMVYFMHLKFEKHLIVFLAVMPIIMIPLVFSPALIDSQTLRANGKTDDRYKTQIDAGHGQGSKHKAAEESGDSDFE